jgi:LPXTG-motif cell wall-anchored protein
MKRPLALLAGSALLSLALAAPADAVDVPPVPVDQLTFPLEQLTGALGLSGTPARDTDDSDTSKAKVRGSESSTHSDVAGAERARKTEKYRAPRHLPKSGAGDSTMLMALAGLGLIAIGGFVYSAGKR